MHVFCLKKFVWVSEDAGLADARPRLYYLTNTFCEITSDARGHSQTAHCGPLKFMGVCGSEYLIFLQNLGVGDAK